MAMLDATFSCLENAVINTCVFGTDPQRVGNSHPTSVPFGTFPTSDGEIIITCSRDPAFYSLCRALGGRIWWRTRASPRRRPDASTRRS